MFKKKIVPTTVQETIKPVSNIINENLKSNEKEEKKPFQNMTQNINISNKSQKIKKPKPQWDTRYNLIEVQYPKEITNDKFKKRYKVGLTYKNNENKIKSKTIRFGRKDVKEFVDDSDPTKKNKICGKLGNTHNLFHGNFWRLHLLNGPSNSMKENYMNLINKIN
jgi:hypothetical protein